MKTNKNEFETTIMMRYYHEQLKTLQDAMPSVVGTQLFWRKNIPMSEKLQFLKELAEAKHRLWNEVYKTYPETKGLSLLYGEDMITELV